METNKKEKPQKMSTFHRKSVLTQPDKISSVPGSAVEGRRLVVVPVDDEEMGRHTIEWYLEHVHRPDNEVHVINVPEMWSSILPSMAPPDLLHHMKVTNAFTASLKQHYDKLLLDLEITGKFVRVGGNKPWSALVEYSRKQKAMFIIMPSRQQTPGLHDNKEMSAPLFTHSVTNDVLLHSQVPVMIARPPATEKEKRKKKTDIL